MIFDDHDPNETFASLLCGGGGNDDLTVTGAGGVFCLDGGTGTNDCFYNTNTGAAASAINCSFDGNQSFDPNRMPDCNCP